MSNCPNCDLDFILSCECTPDQRIQGYKKQDDFRKMLKEKFGQ